MGRALKVYGINWRGTHRRIVAAATQKEAVARFGTSVTYLRNYGSESGNPDEIRTAMGEPGAVFERPNSGRSDYARVEDNQPKESR